MINKPLVIIDTDPGQDDALAILLLALSGTADVRAVTTVAGNAEIQKTTNNARYILDLTDSPIPIYSGAEKPLNKDLVTANVHGRSGLAGVRVSKKARLNGLAVKKIMQIVRANPGQVTILAIGPQTNIATALLRDPGLTKLIKQIVIMGGAINVPGNKSRTAEFNIFVDPEAAKIVFDSGVKIIMIPLDVCNTMPMFLTDFEKIRGKLKRPILAMMKQFIKGIAKFENFEGALVYDALAAYYLINPKAFELKKMDVRVETRGELTAGMTVADQRNWGGKNPNIDVVANIDRSAFVRDFVRILSD